MPVWPDKILLYSLSLFTLYFSNLLNFVNEKEKETESSTAESLKLILNLKLITS